MARVRRRQGARERAEGPGVAEGRARGPQRPAAMGRDAGSAARGTVPSPTIERTRSGGRNPRSTRPRAAAGRKAEGRCDQLSRDHAAPAARGHAQKVTITVRPWRLQNVLRSSCRGDAGVKKYVVLAGNIGAGKTTLVRMMCEKLGWRPYYEPVAENPYLADFYDDMARWAFHSQVFFLTHRVRSHRALMDDPWTVVQDRSVYEDAEVFARNLYLSGRMSERDWTTYLELYHAVITLLPPPDLVVYLQASVPVLRRRIARRGRNFEAAISDEYLAGLNALYEQWMQGFDLGPVVVFPADRMDFVEEAQDFETIVAEVEQRLRGEQRLLF